jgi:hypothetical protein
MPPRTHSHTSSATGPGQVTSFIRKPLFGYLHLLTLGLAILAMYAAATAPSAHAEECPNAAYRTGPSTHLPDCRAYELVTPPFKNSGGPLLYGYSPDGTSALLALTAAIPGSESFPEAGLDGPQDFYSVQRTAAGWTEIPDDLPSSEYLSFGVGLKPEDYQDASLDGQTTVWIERQASQPDNSVSLFLRRPDRSIVDVGPGLPPSTPPGTTTELAQASRMEVAGLSSDGSRVLFTLQGDYWPFDGTESGKSLYEYAGTGNATPRLVGVDQAGTLISKCGTELGDQENSHNAMSTNGQTLFFTALCGARTEDEIYARIDNGESDARTVDISEPSEADCKACDTEAGVLAGAHFEGASQDGSKVFFSTTQPLLGGATGSNIYEYDFDAPAGERIVRVSGGDSTVSAPQPELFGRPLVSEDGSHVYFLAQGVLTTTPNPEGEVAEAGAFNLYVFERDASYPTGRTALVARLSREDAQLWAERSLGGDVTPDGRFLVFTSERDLTPDDTSSKVRQVFEYDAQTGGLVRVSIGQNGFNHNGNVPATYVFPFTPAYHQTFNNADNAEIVRPGASSVTPRSSYHAGQYKASDASTGMSVSADGSYVFFQSTVGLTPQALDRKLVGSFLSNGNQVDIYANNVYEYHDGQVSLISDGQDLAYVGSYAPGEGSQVQLLGTDEPGDDVLFETTDQLVGQDTDTGVDIYDARVDGGFPAPATPPACSGEACQGALSGAPTLLSPGSEFQAGGNPPLAAPAVSKPAVKSKAKVKPKKCRAGKVVKQGRCVKAKGRKAKKAGNERRAKS